MRILLVDDSRAMRMIIKRTLRQVGYDAQNVLEAANGIEALEVLKTEHVDLVLCDWNMPEMNGIELLAELRRQGNQIPFGFITSEGSAEKRQEAADTGAQFLLTKPFSADKFQLAFEKIAA
jgi:two-component system chemotaxis response regulator CheY